MANKKINQLVSKTAILSTDIFGIGDATTGQLFKKTIAELQAAIGGAVISVNGLVGTVVLDTDDIQELATPTNKYFTDARARGAISLTVTGNSGASTYSSGTGVLNVPTYTLAGLGGISATFLSGTSGISYNSTTGVISYSGTVYTDASIRALFSGATGISYNSTTGAISYSGTVYTDSSIRALISMTTTGDSGASTYNNTTGVINVPNYTLAGLGGISYTSLSGGTGITYNNTTGAISYSGTVYTDASIRGLISLTTTGTSGASTYNSTTGVLNIPQYTTDLSGYLPLTGGTLTGALVGTTATFSGLVSLGGATATNPLNIRTANGESYIRFLNADGTTYGDFERSITGSGAIRFTGAYFRLTQQLEVTGAATFSSTITSLATSGQATITAEGSATNGEGAFTVKGKNSSGTIRTGSFKYDNADILRIGTSSAIAMRFETSDVERMRITSAGNVGIGNTNPGSFNEAANQLVVGTTSGNNGITIAGGTTGYSSIYLADGTTGSEAYRGYIEYGHSLDYMDLATSGVNRIRLTGGGNILMGTTSDNGERLYISGNVRATGTITANSDLTLKKNLLKIENALEKVEQINGYTYEFKEDDSKRHAGVIAQEIQTVLPEIVNKGNDGILGVEYGNISALLIEAIKEQQTQINELKALLNK
jgi:hypothetical protein